MEAVRCMRERLIGKQVESCTLWALQARSEEHLKHPDRWLLFEQHLFVPKHVTVLQKMRLALLASIPLASLISSEVLSCAHRADMLLDMLEKCQVVSVRIPSLFQQNVLKAVGRTQIEGSRKVYAGRTTVVGKQIGSCTLWALQARSEEQLKNSCKYLVVKPLQFAKWQLKHKNHGDPATGWTWDGWPSEQVYKCAGSISRFRHWNGPMCKPVIESL